MTGGAAGRAVTGGPRGAAGGTVTRGMGRAGAMGGTPGGVLAPLSS